MVKQLVWAAEALARRTFSDGAAATRVVAAFGYPSAVVGVAEGGVGVGVRAGASVRPVAKPAERPRVGSARVAVCRVAAVAVVAFSYGTRALSVGLSLARTGRIGA